MSSEHFVSVTDESYDKELVVPEPVFVKFTASWCGPCQVLAPVVNELAAEYAGKVKFIEVDIDQCSAIPQRYGIRGVPTMLFIKDGQVANTIVGGQTKSRIQLALDTLLS